MWDRVTTDIVDVSARSHPVGAAPPPHDVPTSVML